MMFSRPTNCFANDNIVPKYFNSLRSLYDSRKQGNKSSSKFLWTTFSTKSATTLPPSCPIVDIAAMKKEVTWSQDWHTCVIFPRNATSWPRQILLCLVISFMTLISRYWQSQIPVRGKFAPYMVCTANQPVTAISKFWKWLFKTY